jgi:hypothetical protein
MIPFNADSLSDLVSGTAFKGVWLYEAIWMTGIFPGKHLSLTGATYKTTKSNQCSSLHKETIPNNNIKTIRESALCIQLRWVRQEIRNECWLENSYKAFTYKKE